mmetsp:Transcript_15494/g.28945  ORF Transcript_15494/g.28945 Transcript_15494/m.28945 type:complete len:106 (-) Transcript_15494:2193-2510(-)
MTAADFAFCALESAQYLSQEDHDISVVRMCCLRIIRETRLEVMQYRWRERKVISVALCVTTFPTVVEKVSKAEARRATFRHFENDRRQKSRSAFGLANAVKASSL